MNFHFILIEMCIFMGICVWTGSSHCFMTQCTIRTVCLTPRVTMQGYESQKCEISINHNLTRLTKHKTVNCSPDDWKSDQDNTRVMIILTVSVFAPSSAWPLSRDPCDPGMARLPQHWAPSPLWPQLIISHPWPLSGAPEEVKLPAAAMWSQVTPILTESMNGHLNILNHSKPGHSLV